MACPGESPWPVNVGSWLAAQGESLHMIGKVLNHSQPSTTAIYAKLHLDPVRAAMERNAEPALATVNGRKKRPSKVIFPGSLINR